jgi:plastocyanin
MKATDVASQGTTDPTIESAPRLSARLLPCVIVALTLPAAVLAGSSHRDTSREEAAPPPASGRLHGTVTLTAGGKTASAATAYARRSVGPRIKAQPDASNVVISFVDLAAGSRAAAARTTITQQGEQFVPRVTAIPRGSTVEFPNFDPYFHNVFSLSRPGTFDLGRYPSGDSRSRVFDKAGIVKVYCHLHAQMSALIRVFDHSWFTIPDARGEFVIEGVPAGMHTLVAWHERIGERQEAVTIRPGATTEVAFTLPVLETAE